MNPLRLLVASLPAILGLFLIYPASASHSEESGAQIVRLSFVQGDVRVSRGNGKRPDLNGPWKKAEINVPIEEGFSLATGQGRAEVEFENLSVAYLAENSLLIFKKLRVKNGVPATQIELATGTATIYVQPAPHESFLLDTPTDTLEFPQDSLLRVDSFLDATMITPREKDGEALHLRGAGPIHLAKGETVLLQSGDAFKLEGENSSRLTDDWDGWVSARAAERAAATSAAMEASGLASPIPGLVDLATNGTFFACAPYGSCWQPNAQTSPGAPPVNAPPVSFVLNCFLGTPLLNEIPLSGPAPAMDNSNFAWAVCHAGSFIYQNNRYLLLVGKTHHRQPIVWVRAGSRVGFVPRNPNDEKGKLPLNLKYGILFLRDRPGARVQQEKPNPGTGIQVLDAPPKEFRGEPFPQLRPAALPEITAHSVLDSVVAARGPALPAGHGEIRYDYQKQAFVRAASISPGQARRAEPVAGLSSSGKFWGEPRGLFDPRSGYTALAIGGGPNSSVQYRPVGTSGGRVSGDSTPSNGDGSSGGHSSSGGVSVHGSSGGEGSGGSESAVHVR